MSVNRTEITPELDKYISEKFSADDEFLIQLRKDAVAIKIPDISISPDQAKFIQILLKSMNTRYVLEIGTLAGYSAITMARALPKDSKLVTVENNNLHYKFALERIKQAGLSDIIEVHYSYALEFFENYKPDYLHDFIFIDADKKNLIKYLEICTPMLRSGGIFAVDNAFALGNLTVENPEFDEIHKHRIHDVYAVREFNEYFRNHPLYDTCMLTIGDGLIMGVKK